MKKIGLLIVISMISFSTYACDICGCAGMTVGFGNLSFYNQHQIGVRYSLRQFNSALGSSDYFHQIDINGTYVLNDDFLISGTLPFITANRTGVETGNNTLSGIGDATLKLTYYPWRYGKGDLNLRLGTHAGLNLPTGSFEDRIGTLIPQNFQIGTGSLDYLFESDLQFGYKNWVGLLQARYLVNTVNNDAYKFGNQSGVQLTAAYKIGFTKTALAPLITVSYENFDRDVNSRGFYQFGTGGESFNLLTGLQFKTKSWLWSIRGGTNLSQTGSEDYAPGLQLYLRTTYLF